MTSSSILLSAIALFYMVASYPCMAVEFEVRQVADINQGPGASSPRFFHAALGRVFFAANDGERDGLYVWNGSTTNKVGDVRLLGYSCSVAFNDEFFFVGASEDADRFTLMKTDGHTIVDLGIEAGHYDEWGEGYCSGFGELENQVFFAGKPDVESRFQLLKLDSGGVSAVGTWEDAGLVYDFRVFNNELFFADHIGGLLKTDGQSISRVDDSFVGFGPDLEGAVWFDDKLYFYSQKPDSSGSQLSRTDGQAVETVFESSRHHPTFRTGGAFRDSQSQIRVLGDELYFLGATNDGISLFRTDGTSVSEAIPLLDSPTMGFGRIDSELIFNNFDGVYRTDGTEATKIGDSLSRGASNKASHGRFKRGHFAWISSFGYLLS